MLKAGESTILILQGVKATLLRNFTNRAQVMRLNDLGCMSEVDASDIAIQGGL